MTTRCWEPTLPSSPRFKLQLGDAAARGEDVAERFAALGRLTADIPAAYRALPLIDRPVIGDVLPSWRTFLEK